MNFIQRIFGRTPEPAPATRELTSEQFKLLTGWITAPSASGITVTTETALSIPAVYAAVSSVCDTIATLPFPVFRRADQGGEKDYDHPVYRLLNIAPNSIQTPKVFRHKMVFDLITEGEFFAEIERANDGNTPVALWPIAPSAVSTNWEKVPDEDGNTREVFVYRVAGKVFDPANLIHIVGFSLDGLRGKSSFSLCRDSLGLSIALERFGSSFFKNGARPSGLLTAPPGIDKEMQAEAKAAWQTANSGVDNAGQTAVLPDGYKYDSITIPPEEGQYHESRVAQIREAQRICRVSPPITSDYERQTWNNIQYARMQDVQNTYRPLCVAIEQELNRKLLANDSERYVEHVLEGLLRGSFTEQINTITQAVGGPVYTPNEGRKVLGLPAVEGGDELVKKTTPAPVQPVAEQEKIDNPEENGKAN